MRQSYSLIFILLLIISFAGCDASTSGESATESQPGEVTTVPEATPEGDRFDPRTDDDETAAWLSNLLVTEYLSEDLDYIDENERTFQYYQVDLNNDGDGEYFVRFMNSWFCGTGGCTFFLLSGDGEMITKFTVMNPPLFVEPTMKNGWAILLVKDRGEWKELAYEDGSYPSNPTMLEKAPYDAPSGHALILFGDAAGQAKTYSF